MRTIALEEHFTTPEVAAYSANTAKIAQPGVWDIAVRKLLEFGDSRIADMDAAGLDMQVVSLNAPGVQAEPDAAKAVIQARAANDLLAEAVGRRPDRFAGFASLPLQDPQAAVRELERAVGELGFKGALVNAHSQGKYLDHPDFEIIWDTLTRLDVPVYLHPANGVDTPDVLSGHKVLVGPMWNWGLDVASHVLRLVFGGTFDKFPSAKLLIGHMGEGLPFYLWRIDSRWGWHNHFDVDLRLEQPSEYIRRNVYITTSGVCDPAPLQCSLQTMGADHVLFATDYPFEDLGLATEFLRNAPIAEGDRALIAHGNAERLLRL